MCFDVPHLLFIFFTLLKLCCNFAINRWVRVGPIGGSFFLSKENIVLKFGIYEAENEILSKISFSRFRVQIMGVQKVLASIFSLDVVVAH